MLKEIVSTTANYTKEHGKAARKKKGQFFTPLSIVDFMVKKGATAAEHLSILEPGAGNGLLTAALIKQCLNHGLCHSFSVHFIENDPDILPVLRVTAELISDYAAQHHAYAEIKISDQNYITAKDNTLYDIVICNPPYKKIRKDSEESMCMNDYVYGQPNLYALFMCKAMHHLKPNGKFIFITPRSWVSGNYYKVARKFLLENLNLTDLLLFEDRNKVFDGEDVLQETLITIGTKSTVQEPKIHIYTTPDDSEKFGYISASAESIKSVGTDSYLLLPSSEADLQVIQKMASITDTFESLGYCFKTGPVVEFRNKEALSADKKDGYVPMYRSANIVNGNFIFPADTTKAQYVKASEKKLLLSNSNTVLLRRLSAKEEKRRLQSCAYYRSGTTNTISIENHVNYLVRTDHRPLSAKEVEWIHGLLMSDEYDTYYRLINGSTQVNAGELNKLPLRRNL